MREIKFTLGNFGTIVAIVILAGIGFVGGRASVNHAKYCQTK